MNPRAFLATFIILVPASFLFFQPSALAGEEPYTMESVVVTADRWESGEEKVTDRVTVITSEEIRKLPVRDAGEALDYMPGVTMDRGGQGNPGGVVFPSVQGAEYYQTPVMINGIPFSSLKIGLGNLGQIQPGVIDRIEVLHGSGGLEWGSAMGGVINIITLTPESKRKNSIVLGAGENGTTLGDLTYQYLGERTSLVVSGGYRASEGPDKDSSSVNNTSSITTIRTILGEKTHVNLTSFNFKGETGTGLYKGDLEGYWEVLKYDTTGAGLTVDRTFGDNAMELMLYTRQMKDKADASMVGVGDLGGWETHDKINGGSAIFKSDLGVASLTAGVDIKQGTLNDIKPAEKDYSLDTYGAFASVGKEVDNIIMNAGVRWSDEDYFDSFTGFSAGVKYDFVNTPVSVKLSAASGYTVPPLQFRFLEINEIWAPNPDLVVEKALSYQLGVLAGLAEGLTLDANIFFATLDNAIVPGRTSEELSQYQNIGKGERQGVEAQIKYVAHGFNVFANTLNQELKDKETGELVKGKIKATHSFGLGYEWNNLLIVFSGVWRDRNARPEDKAKDKVWIFGVRANYALQIGKNDLNISLTGANLTEQETYSFYMLPDTYPRQIELSLAYAF